MSSHLSDMIGVMNHTEDRFSWALLKIQKDELVTSEDMPVILESNVKLAVALGVLNECFNPVQDRRTKIDMLHQAVYSLGYVLLGIKVLIQLLQCFILKYANPDMYVSYI